MSELVTFEELQNWYGVKHCNAVLQCLDEDGIDYKLNKKGRPRTIRTEVLKAWYSKDKDDWSNFE